jgi:uncharacterized protein (TIGR03437 family)
MRYFAALLASAALVSAADFRNGQAAWAVIGQPSFTAQTAPPSQTVTGTAGGLAWVNGRLLISEGNRIGATSTGADGSQTPGNRVLIFDGTNPNYLPSPRSDVASTGNLANPRCPVCGFSATNVLGQPNFNSTAVGLQNGFRNPTAVASDGTAVAVADTDNNRVLLWKSFPTSNGQPPDLVLGQKDFATVQLFAGVHNNTLRGPQGVWIQNGKLFVADTQNHRVLIWNSIPTQNQQPADVVLGQKDFESAEAPSGNILNPPAAQNRLFSPTSVTSDGVRVYVSDLGFNRVLIWNSVPTGIDQPADVVVGQPDFVASTPNNSRAVCASEGNDSNNQPIYPARCEKTLDFPRYALSDGRRLFIADGGNDRVLIYNTIPAANTAAADIVLGQPDFTSDIVSDPTVQFASTTIPNRASTNTVRTPTSLAWDGTNLYVTDPFDLRVLVFTAGDNATLSDNSILNAASLSIFQQGVIVIGGTINANDTVTITINNTAVTSSASKSYTYTVQKSDTVATVAQGLVKLIDASPGDPNVTALSNQFGQILLTSRQSQLPNNTISISASVSAGAQLTATASGSYLTGGNAAVIAPGTLVVINGQNLTDGSTVPATPGATSLPTSLGGAQVYMDGIAAPLVSVSPTQIEAQVPYAFQGANSASIYVRTTTGGSTQITNATPIIIAQANPGIFAGDGNDPRPAVALHSSDHASAVVSVDGSITAGDSGTITIGSNSYTYKVQASDTLATVRDALIAQIQSDPNVTPSAGGQFTRVVLTARPAGSGGNGIPVSASTSSGAALVLTAYTSSTCCASTPMAPVTPSNPAQPNETITLLTTGLGPLVDATPVAGQAFSGSVQNTVTETVSATLAGSTAQVINAGVPHNGIGVYQVDIIIPSGVTADTNAQVYIAQDAFVSNIATLPVAGSGNPLVTFTASPNIIITSGQYGQTTLNWNAPGIQTIEIHIGAPDGPLFALGNSQGSADTGNWVVDGTTFYLEDVTNGKLPSTVNTLASLTVRLGTPQTVTSFSGTDVNIPRGYSFGPSTLTWNAPVSSKIEIHAGSPDGPLFTVGNSSGSATTGSWVTAGTVLYLVDVSDPNNSFVLKSITFGAPGAPAVTFNAPPTFTIEPGTISAPYSPWGYFGVAKISWNSPLTPNVEVHVGSPTGPVFTFGGTEGSATTGPWITNGMQFYLQDVSYGFPLTSAHTLAVATASVVPQVEQGYLLLEQGPMQNPAGQSYGSATLNWSTTTATNVEVHVGSPDGPLFTAGGPQGSATASGWVTNGMTFFLQDTSNGEPLTSEFTIATQTVNFVPYTPIASFQASPNPILVAPGTLYGTTTLYWNSPYFGTVEIHIGSPDGPLLAQGLSTGSVTTGPWVTDGMIFYLQDVTNHNPLTLDHTLAAIQTHLQAKQ